MSVTMHLYKKSDAEYLGSYIDKIGNSAFNLNSDGFYGLELIEKRDGSTNGT